MIELDPTIPAELAPLSWLIGLWEGSGVVNYDIGDETRHLEFGQRVSFTQDGLPYLNYTSYTWLLEPDADDPSGDTFTSSERAYATETGYWRLSRRASEGDQGPGLLPGVGERIFNTATAVETLRTDDGAFDIEMSVVHPTGVSELYLGQVKGPRIDLATDAVMRTATAKDYAAATRIYGLVEGHLLWAWDIAALGQDLRTHASGRLARVE